MSWSVADPGFFLGGGALVSCSTSTPINHIVFFLQNTSCIRKPQVISGWGGGEVRTPCNLPLDPPLLVYSFPQQIWIICRAHFTELMEMLLYFTKNRCLTPLNIFEKKCFINLLSSNIHVVVNFLSQVIFVFLLFLDITRSVNEVETK